ncbi:4Fe-4S binding protein [Ereboglobus luteus]|uniref:4Fe-4S ferredoxin-type domain-containing protein n=1 Tax=Ereboglobus luteus TaxID=1796921 RepID=A0A2U8E1F7_9BACT|nr:4Fe-4S binding protein [Ereboglobus luteus]AWI08687.1 hypothetical protein CKA38_04950 [Ereboglobus luteus]
MKNLSFRFNIQILRTISQVLFFALSLLLVGSNRTVGTVLFALVFFIGVFFCGWVCPFGSLQEWIGKLGDMLKIKKRRLPQKFQRIFQITRYVIFALFIYKIFYAPLRARATFGEILTEGFSNVTVAALVILMVILVLSLFIHRPFCNYFCEKGASYGLFSVLRIFSLKKDASKCVNCRKCDKNCPMNVEISRTNFVRHPNCINCFQCMGNCSRKAISYGIFKLSKSNTTSQTKIYKCACAGRRSFAMPPSGTS